MEAPTNGSVNGPRENSPAAGLDDSKAPAHQAGRENGRARRALAPDAVKRQEQAKALADLAKKQCRNCGSIGCWEIDQTRPVAGADAKIRYIRCKACGRSAKA